jgi:hypothetical protein
MPSHRSSILRALTPASLALALTFVNSHPVAADHGYRPVGGGCSGPPANCISVAFDVQHNIIFFSVESAMKTA